MASASQLSFGSRSHETTRLRSLSVQREGTHRFRAEKIPVEVILMLGDDEATPTRMIGKKMAPILEHKGRYIPESMDIVAYVDALAGGPVLRGPPPTWKSSPPSKRALHSHETKR